MPYAKVLKDFLYAHDGVHVRTMTKGVSFSCQDDVFDGLVKDGYIKATKPPADEQEAAPEAPAAADPQSVAAAATGN